MTAFRQHIRIWAIWTLAISSLLMANPWGGLGWVELTAAVAPMIMFAERRMKREPMLAIGLPILTLMWIFDSSSASILRLIVAWAAFGVGVLLASRTIRSQLELESIAGKVAFAPLDSEAPERFLIGLERELARARRHERSFALLSAAAHPRSLEADASGLFRSELLRSLAENRARLELQEFLRTELHVYSDVAMVGSRVLALVPEVENDALQVLLERLNNAADEVFDFDVQIGASSFPDSAVCANDLIDIADRNRTASKLRSLPERVVSLEDDLSEWRSPDVQG